jgi:hypothetical protein
MKPRRDVKETFKIGLTLQEKTKKKTKPAQNAVFNGNNHRTEKNKQRNSKETTTTKSTTISKQPSAYDLNSF